MRVLRMTETQRVLLIYFFPRFLLYLEHSDLLSLQLVLVLTPTHGLSVV